MPRGGSKKGEHRGNAKPKAEGTPNALMKAAVVRKPGVGHQRRQRVNDVEQEIFVSQVIHGIRSANDMTAKDIMVDNMHRFQNAAYEYEAMAIIAARGPDTEETRRIIRHYEAEEERNRRIASDEGYKVAPYMHNRRAAIAVIEGGSLGDDIVKLMLDEIDRRNREHPMVIEHEPQKKTA